MCRDLPELEQPLSQLSFSSDRTLSTAASTFWISRGSTGRFGLKNELGFDACAPAKKLLIGLRPEPRQGEQRRLSDVQGRLNTVVFQDLLPPCADALYLRRSDLKSVQIAFEL